VVGLLVVKEDFGTAALIGIVVLAMLFVGRVVLWHLLVMMPPLAAGAVFFIAHEAYRLKRILAFIDPFANPQQEGYHLIQSLLSYASGGVAGRGLGNGVQKLGYLPEDTTDFIFAIICEELGLFGAILTVLLYLGLLWACWNIIRQSRDTFGRMLAFGVGTMIGVQAMLNIAVATVSVPPKGLPLPLVSFGGSGLVITSAMLGLVYSVGRIAEKEAGEEALPLAGQLSAG
jgi:cell division protein FtsW